MHTRIGNAYLNADALDPERMASCIQQRKLSLEASLYRARFVIEAEGFGGGRGRGGVSFRIWACRRWHGWYFHWEHVPRNRRRCDEEDSNV